MALQDKLSALKTQFQSGEPPFDKVPPSVHAAMQRGTDELIASGAADRARCSGQAPGFTLNDGDGRPVSLADLMKQGPVVVTFYRGIWCPYCNLDLEATQAVADEITALGASIVAITPQTQANSRALAQRHGVAFPVLSDPGNAVADAYGLRYRLPDYLIELYGQLGVALPAVNGDDSWTLPMPARFIIDAAGAIRHAEVAPDYTRRSDPRDLLPVLQDLHCAAA